jgi:hypothetical protein
MSQDFTTAAPRLFKRIPQDGQVVKGSIFIDGFGKGKHGRRPPAWIKGHRLERVTKNFTE